MWNYSTSWRGVVQWTGPQSSVHVSRPRHFCHSIYYTLAAGDNDVTILLKPQAGSRRWQHVASGRQLQVEGRLSPIESNYTVILGSHRNSCLKFEKDGEICCMVSPTAGKQASRLGGYK